MVRHDCIDIDEPVERDQQRAGEQDAERSRVAQSHQIVADLAAEDHDDEAERQRPEDALRQHLDRRHAIEQLEEERDETPDHIRSEEHTSELQSLMRISYAVFCLKKKTEQNSRTHENNQSKELKHITH